jgi:tryptophan-rich sensory protein
MARPMRIGAATPRGQWSALAMSLLLVAVAGGIGALASIDARAFYLSLVKPDWAPPAEVFGPVWTLLYACIGFAAWIVWRARGGIAHASDAFLLYGLQLALNALWSWIFFQWHGGALALVEICALWLTIFATTVHFWRIRRTAGLLMTPYLLWVSFATALTAATWHLNPGIL